MEIKTVHATAFKVLVEALKDLLTDTSVEFDDTGMKILAMDTSHVVMVHLKLEKSEFNIYHCDGPINVAFNMLNFHKLIKTINNSSTLSLYIDREDPNHLGIKIENSEKNSRTTYKLNLLDLDHQKIIVPPTEFTEVITLPSTEFQMICRNMSNLAEYMEICSVDNEIIFRCKGDFSEQETVVKDKSANALKDVEGKPVGGGEIVQGVFSIKHLVHFTKCTNLCTTVELYLKNDYPLIIRYGVATLGSIRLALAPHEDK